MSQAEPLRPQLGAHAEALIADVLQKREDAIMAGALVKVSSQSLDPATALQVLIAVNEIRVLRRTLIKRAETENARRAQLA